MTLSTYASLRQTTPGVTFATGTGGSLSAGSAWFCVQARNRVGKNLLSTPFQLTWSSGAKVVITIGSTARATGEEILEWVISTAATNTPSAMRQIAAIRAKNNLVIGPNTYPGQGTDKALPLTLELTTDAQLLAGTAVANNAALPTTGLPYGAMRFVTATSEYVRYDDLATSGIIAATTGYWVSSSQVELETFLSATTATGGCDRALNALTDTSLLYPPPPYGGTGTDSSPTRFWVSNGLTVGGVELPQGTRIALQLFANSREVSPAFGERVLIKTVGTVNRSTGVLTTLSGDYVTWSSTTPLETPVPLPAGSALVYEIVFRFYQAELASIVTNGTKVLLNLFVEGLLGTPDSSWAITGDAVLDIGNKLRLVPTVGGLKRLSGSCLVGGYKSPFVGETEILSLPADTAGLKAAISAALAAQVTVRGPSDTLYDTEALRAVIGTVAGTQAPSNSVSVTTTAINPAISLQINYPTAVRSDYPDLIAGTTASLNVPQVYIYVTFSGTIYRLPAITPVSPTQTVTIDGLGSATVVGSLPTSAANFGLFGYGTLNATPAGGASTLTNGNYQIRIAYHYPSPSTAVSSISHAPSDGCIGEIRPLQDAIDNASQIFTGTVAPASGTGAENDVYIQVNSGTKTISIYRKNAPSAWSLTGSIQALDGSAGANGTNGLNAYSTTTANFTVPAANANVTVSLSQTGWMTVNAFVFIEGAGYYQVVSKTSNSASLKNLGYTENAAASTVITSGKVVVSSGPRGATGAAGGGGGTSSSDFTITRSAGTYTNSTGVVLHVPNATTTSMLEADSTGYSSSIRLRYCGERTLWLPAEVWYPSASGGAAALSTINSNSSRVSFRGFPFSGTTNTSIETITHLPSSFDQTDLVDITLLYTSATASGSPVEWEVANLAAVDQNAFGTTNYPTADSLDFTAPDTAYKLVEAGVTGAAINFVGTPAPRCALALKVTRLGSTDTNNNAAQFLGVRLVYKINTPNDRHNFWLA